MRYGVSTDQCRVYAMESSPERIAMAGQHVYLDALTSTTRSYKVKVKVVEKGKPQRLGLRNILYQSVLLQDDKGNKMRGVLFGDQIEGHKGALVYNGVYEIANAPLKPCSDQYKRDPAELNYTMGFGRQTIIRPLNSTDGPVLPDYQCISQVPKIGDPNEKFDVVGIFMFVEEAARKVTTVHGRENSVREVLLVDHSLEQPIVVSTWNDLAETDCDKLASLPQPFTVLGFTALRISPHKGFSLTTTMSTDIDFVPVGPKAVALVEWVGQHKEPLSDLQARILEVKNPNRQLKVMTIATLKAKKVRNTLQDERHILQVTVPFADFEKVNAYLGCSNCGRRTDFAAAGQTFNCEHCTKEAVLSEPRITFNFEVSDGTGTLDITTFTADTETLFRMSAPDIFHMMHSGDKQSYGVVQASLQNVSFSIEVSPKTMLSRNNILQWGLRRVMLEPEDPPSPLNGPPVPSSESTTPLLQEKNQELSKESVPIARRLDFERPPENSTRIAVVSISSQGTVAVATASTPLTDKVLDTAHPQTPIALSKSTQSPGYPAPPLLSEVVHECQVAKHGSKESTVATVVPLLKTPKVEKHVPLTPGPETPAQNAAKRSSGMQATESPGKKKKPESLNIGQ